MAIARLNPETATEEERSPAIGHCITPSNPLKPPDEVTPTPGIAPIPTPHSRQVLR